MSKEINLEEILSNISIECEEETHPNEIVFKAMKEAIKQALELAAENATIEDEGNINGQGEYDEYYIIDKESITDTIKQVK